MRRKSPLHRESVESHKAWIVQIAILSLFLLLFTLIMYVLTMPLFFGIREVVKERVNIPEVMISPRLEEPVTTGDVEQYKKRLYRGE